MSHSGGHPRSRIRRVFLTIVLAAAVVVPAVIGVFLWAQPRGASASADTSRSAAPAGTWFTVAPMSFDLAVIASGELEAGRQVELKCKVEGTSTIVEVVPEGTAVQEGDVLVRLASDEIKEKVEQERLSTEQSRTDRIAAEQEVAIQENEADNSLKAAQLKLELAQLDLKKWEQGDDPKKKRELQLALQKAQRSLDRAKETVELSEQLFKEDFISKSELDDDRLALVEAEAALETAKLDIDIYAQYMRPKEMKKYQSDVDQAAAELERTTRRNESKLAQARAALAAKTSQLKIREDRLAKMREQLENTVMHAPQAGLVVYATTVAPSWQRRGNPIAQGRQVRFNESIIVLPDTSHMVAKVKVHEALMSKVRVGQKAVVTIDAWPGVPIEGEVSEIGVMAEDGGWMNPDLREYAVKVALPPQTGKDLKPAMRCTGRIMLGRAEDVLAVPIQAMFTEGRQHFCYVPAGESKVKAHPVKIGRSSETHVEIVAGLFAGDIVLLRRPKAGEVVADERSKAKPPESPPTAAPQTQPAA